MIDFSELSLEAFQVLRAYGKDIVLYDENGNRVFEPSDARRFYISGDNILVSILEDGDNSSVKVYLSTNIQISEVLEFITVLRRIATQFNVLFNVRKYNKKITPRDFATQAAVKEQKEYSMNIMEGLYGTSKSSYLKLENARMIVRHSARVKENMIGGRGRSIQSIFVENSQGERLLFPVNVLSGARAMTQHVNHGGTFADEVGQQIIRMAQDFSDLSKVAGHIGANQKNLPSQAMRVRESVRSSGYDIRRTFERMCRDEASYIRESARITEAQALTEGSEHIAETVEALQSLLTIGDVTLDTSILETVAKLVGFTEDMRPDSAPADDATDPDDGKPAQPIKPTQPVAPGQSQDSDDKDSDNADEADADQQDGSFHEDEDMDDSDAVDEDEEMGGDEVAETAAIRAFDAWMESFDPDSFFGEGKSFKRNDDDEEMTAAEKKKKDQEKRDAAKNKKQDRTDESGQAMGLGNGDNDLDEAMDEEISPEMLRDCGYDVQEVAEHVRSNADRWSKQYKVTYVPEGSNDFPQLLGIEYDLDSAWQLAADHFAERQGSGIVEGKSFKRNDDDEEMTASERKKKDQEKRDAAKNKKVPVTESSESTYEVYGTMGMNSKSFRKSFKTEAAREAWLDKNSENISVHGFADPEPASVEEGKSFKRNKDEDSTEKKKQDKQRRQDRKQEPIEEASLIKNWLVSYDDTVLGKFADADEAVEFAKMWETKTLADKDPSVKFYFDSLKVQTRDGRLYWDAEYGGPNFSSLEEGKSFKRNDDDSEMTAAERKKQDQEKRDAAKSKKTPVEESVITESSDDEEAMYMLADQTPDTFGVAAEYVKRRLNGNLTGVSHALLARLLFLFFKNRVEQNDLYPSEHVIHGYVEDTAIPKVAEILHITLTEGKSFKRNDDEEVTAAEKKKKDQQKRDAAKNKKTPVEEGKSFKKNDDDEEMSAAEKKKKDQQKRDAAKSKKERTDESIGMDATALTMALNKAVGAVANAEVRRVNENSVVIAYLNGRDIAPAMMVTFRSRIVDAVAEVFAQFGLVMDETRTVPSNKSRDLFVVCSFTTGTDPIDEGKSFKRNNEDGDKKKKDDQQRRKEREDKQDRTDEASDISFNDAKTQIKQVKGQLSKMSPFDKNYVSMKAHLQKLEDRLSRNGDDDLDEAIGGESMSLEQIDSILRRSGLNQALTKVRSDSNYGGILDTVAAHFGEPVAELLDNFTSADKLHYNQETSAVGEFLSNLPAIVALMNSISSTDESYVSGDGGYGGDSSDVIESAEEEDFQSWLENGNPVKFKVGTGYDHPGVWTPSQVNMTNGRCWVGDADDRGWYVNIDHLEPHHGDDEDDMEEDCVIPRNMSKSLASEVEKKPDAQSGEADDQSYISRLRTLAGMNKI
jgi:hypothetical protein